MDTASAVDTPVRRKLGAEDVAFKRLDIDDVEYFGGLIKVERAKKNDELAAKHKLDNWQAFRAEQELEHGGVSVGEVFRWMKTPPGVKAVYERMVKVSGFTPEQGGTCKKWLGPAGQVDLAVEALSPPPLPPQDVPNSGPTPPKD